MTPAVRTAEPETRATAWSGLLAIDKPAGITSHDAVEKVRRRLRSPGAGHLGTLDPAATGLLMIAMGAATRCIPVWQGGEKLYEATIRFGIVTDTQDTTGAVLGTHDTARLDEARVREAARAFEGEQDQVPPMVSALRSRGRRLHQLARRGEEIARAPRRVRIREWTWTGFQLPEATARIRCSSGTYVRTLAHDLGAALGCGAALAALRRLRSEPFGIETALPLRALDTMPAEDAFARAGIPLDAALEVLPAVTLDEAEVARVGYGGKVGLDRVRAAAMGIDGATLAAGARSVVLRAAVAPEGAPGTALALGEVVADPAGPQGSVLVCPHVVFPWAVRQGRW